MFGLGISELIVILALFTLLFGSKKIPELARGIGEAMKEFKKSQKETLAEDNKESKS